MDRGLEGVGGAVVEFIIETEWLEVEREFHRTGNRQRTGD